MQIRWLLMGRKIRWGGMTKDLGNICYSARQKSSSKVLLGPRAGYRVRESTYSPQAQILKECHKTQSSI